MQLIDVIVAMSIDEVFENPHVAERRRALQRARPAAEEQIRRCATVHGNLVVLDLRDEEVIHPTNRFTLYRCSRSATSRSTCSGACASRTRVRDRQVDPGPRLKTNVGELMLQYGGGGTTRPAPARSRTRTRAASRPS